MTTTHAAHPHHGSTQALRKLGRAMKSRATTLERVEDARAYRAQTEQVHFVRAFRM